MVRENNVGNSVVRKDNEADVLDAAGVTRCSMKAIRYRQMELETVTDKLGEKLTFCWI